MAERRAKLSAADKRRGSRRLTEAADTASLANARPIDALPPTAQRMLAAARRVVIRGGYGALSMQAVADEAGELKSTVAYHFGDKAGLVLALLESVIHDGNVSVVNMLDSIPTASGRMHELLHHHRLIAATDEYWRLLFALLPEIVKNKHLRARFGELMRWYYQIQLRCLGLDEAEEPSQEAELLASLLLAVLEGFALQRELIPDAYDLEPRFDLWERIITPYVQQLRAEHAARQPASTLPAGESDGRTAT